MRKCANKHVLGYSVVDRIKTSHPLEVKVKRH
jgi:hypothetical protein